MELVKQLSQILTIVCVRVIVCPCVMFVRSYDKSHLNIYIYGLWCSFHLYLIVITSFIFKGTKKMCTYCQIVLEHAHICIIIFDCACKWSSSHEINLEKWWNERRRKKTVVKKEASKPIEEKKRKRNTHTIVDISS